MAFFESKWALQTPGIRSRESLKSVVLRPKKPPLRAKSYCRKIRLDCGYAAAFSAMLRSFSGKSGMAMSVLSSEGILSGEF